MIFVVSQFAKGPLKRLNTYRLILKDSDFLNRANQEFTNILAENQELNESIVSQEVANEETTD